MLTKKDIQYIIFTGGLTEIKSFKNLVYEILGKDVIIYLMDEIGIRDNKYITSIHYDLRRNERDYPRSIIFTNDIENFTIAPNLKLLKGKLSFSGNFGLQFNNLDNSKTTDTRNIVYSANASFNSGEHWTASVNFSNFNTYTRVKPQAYPYYADALDSLNRTKKEDKYHNDSIEELSKMAAGSNLHEEMEELVKSYLNYFHEGTRGCKKILVIAIDDLDVQTNHTYKMVEQIRKYLIIDNVIILIGVKLVQLSDLIKKKYSEDFSNKEDGNDKIDDMVARYLMKLLPLSHRLNLPSYNEIPGVKLIITDQSKSTANETDQGEKEASNAIPEGANIQETIIGLIYGKTDFMFYNSLEQESLIIPNNLRELLNLVALLYNMSDNPEDKNNNRKVFRQYFIESWCLDRLTSKQHSFIKEMNECDSICINKFIIDYINREYNRYIKPIEDPCVNAILNP